MFELINLTLLYSIYTLSGITMFPHITEPQIFFLLSVLLVLSLRSHKKLFKIFIPNTYYRRKVHSCLHFSLDSKNSDIF